MLTKNLNKLLIGLILGEGIINCNCAVGDQSQLKSYSLTFPLQLNSPPSTYKILLELSASLRLKVFFYLDDENLSKTSYKMQKSNWLQNKDYCELFLSRFAEKINQSKGALPAIPDLISLSKQMEDELKEESLQNKDTSRMSDNESRPLLPQTNLTSNNDGSECSDLIAKIQGDIQGLKDTWKIKIHTKSSQEINVESIRKIIGEDAEISTYSRKNNFLLQQLSILRNIPSAEQDTEHEVFINIKTHNVSTTIDALKTIPNLSCSIGVFIDNSQITDLDNLIDMLYNTQEKLIQNYAINRRQNKTVAKSEIREFSGAVQALNDLIDKEISELQSYDSNVEDLRTRSVALHSLLSEINLHLSE